MVVDYFGEPDLARDLSGHPTEAEVTPDEMISGLKYGHGQFILFSNLSNIDANFKFIDQVKRIEEHFCASWVRSWWRDPDNKSQELFNRAKTQIAALLENLPQTGGSGPSYTSQTYTYRTPGLNPVAQRYRSPRVDI